MRTKNGDPTADLSPLSRPSGASERTGTAGTATHHRRLCVTGVMAELPTIVLVRSGLKQMMQGSTTIEIGAGEAVLVPPAVAFTLVNEPAGGEFVSTMLSPAPRLVDQIAEEYTSVLVAREASLVTGMQPEFLEAFERAVAAVSDPGRLPLAVIENREREVLIWLAHRGLKFGRGATTVAQQVRLMLLQDLAHDWTAPQVARAVAMSEATLRRRLHEQGFSFRQLLIDVRMTRALSLLQVTDLPVQQIALDVGYDSASRFAARFRQRFDVSPSAVRA